MAGRYRGVTKRGQGWQIAFSLPDGTRCRELARFPHSRKGEEEAFRLRATVLADIDRGTFDYAETFPRSRRARQLSSRPGNHQTVEEALKLYLVRKHAHLAISTRRDYEYRIYKHLIPECGRCSLSELSPALVRAWIGKAALSAKAINNILIPLRDICREAYLDEIIDQNPMDRVPALPVRSREPQPFAKAEVISILRALNRIDKQARLFYQLAFSTGLRTGELIALKWDDVDLGTNAIFISRSRSRGVDKGPKTPSGRRSIELNRIAVRALVSLRTLNDGADVFQHPTPGLRLKNGDVFCKRFWNPALDSLPIKRRNPYQCRHTFASHLLMKGHNPLFVAQQMGHRDWGMIRRVYGRYIVESQ